MATENTCGDKILDTIMGYRWTILGVIPPRVLPPTSAVVTLQYLRIKSEMVVIKRVENEKFTFSKALHGCGSDLGIDLFQQPRIFMISWRMKGATGFMGKGSIWIFVGHCSIVEWFLNQGAGAWYHHQDPSLSSDVSTFTVSQISNCFSRTAMESSRDATCL